MVMIILFILHVYWNFEMDNSGVGTRNVTGNNPVVWVDQEMLNVASGFVRKGVSIILLPSWVPLWIRRCFPRKGIKGCPKNMRGVLSLFMSVCFL